MVRPPTAPFTRAGARTAGDPRRLGWIVVGSLLVLVASCTSSRAAEEGSPAAATSPTAGSSSPFAPSEPRPCENPDSGTCQGKLKAGVTYSSVDFIPGVTYSVPTAGWANWEDNPGTFLLVPPGNELAGVNGQWSDFVGVATSIAAARFTDLRGCELAPIASVPTTPEGIASWMRRQPELRVTEPAPASIGGLDGLMVDVRTAPGARVPTCSMDGERFTVFLLFTGLDPSQLAHGAFPGATTRLYLFDHDDGTLVVEVSDVDDAPGTLRSLSAVAEGLTFAV